jgi:hypothetical protein
MKNFPKTAYSLELKSEFRKRTAEALLSAPTGGEGGEIHWGDETALVNIDNLCSGQF